MISPTPEPIVGANFGTAVGAVRDVGGDGLDDFFVGASGDWVPDSGTPSGRVFIFSGATRLPIRTLMLPGGPALTYFGDVVAALDDVDSDGRGDLVVGAPGQSPPPGVIAGGRAHVYSGATGQWLYEITGMPDDGQLCGIALPVGGFPDLDGDGLSEVGIGTYTIGCSYYRVTSGATGAELYTVLPFDLGRSGLGQSAKSLPDLDGDGVPELLLPSPESRLYVGDPQHGRVYVLSGATGQVIRALASPLPSLRFGWSLDTIADLDGDGFLDILIGDTGRLTPDAPFNSGLMHVFSGQSGAHIRSIGSPAPILSGHFGTMVVAQNDLDGDGREDFLVTSFRQSLLGLPEQSGVAYLYSGATGQLLRTIASPNPEYIGWFGSRAARFPESRPDRRGTIAIASTREWNGRGRVYLFASCRADTDADGRINSRDLTRFLTGWIQTAALLPGQLGPPGVHHGDFNADGVVNSADISAFLSAWLTAVAAGGCA